MSKRASYNTHKGIAQCSNRDPAGSPVTRPSKMKGMAWILCNLEKGTGCSRIQYEEDKKGPGLGCSLVVE